MIRQTDFFTFYQQLELKPDCNLAELKNAYRRRVAELHPDRNPHGAAEEAAQLQELTATYTAVLAFERRHGRLPGTQVRLRADATAATGRSPLPKPDATRRTGLRRIVFGTLTAAAILWVIHDQLTGREFGSMESPPEEQRFVAVPPPVTEVARDEATQLQLGMEAAVVRAIEGKPVMENPERWDYGPSWIEFDHGRVSDWYSSRLRPLKVSKPRPTEK